MCGQFSHMTVHTHTLQRATRLRLQAMILVADTNAVLVSLHMDHGEHAARVCCIESIANARATAHRPPPGHVPGHDQARGPGSTVRVKLI